ncbi:DinB family protein [Streptomyces sp. NPDC006879]|uniref:DinB family protein n=1 Tax=Streptomyces sp. NPDC006879 TaxID=3364767 RepID=UPI0036B4AD47
MLEGWLEFHRSTLAAKCEGLDEEQLRRAAVPPSTLTLMGLVRHMAEVERYWFAEIFEGADLPELYSTEDDVDGDFHYGAEDSYAEGVATWRSEMERARRISAGRGLDEVSASRKRQGQTFSLRWIYTHMIEEYARHNGHADLLREQIDGATGF